MLLDATLSLYYIITIRCLLAGDDSETLLQCVCGGEDGEGSDDGDDGRMVQYFIKVMRLFEHVPSPSYVVRVTEVATNLVNRKYPNAVRPHTHTHTYTHTHSHMTST